MLIGISKCMAISKHCRLNSRADVHAHVPQLYPNAIGKSRATATFWDSSTDERCYNNILRTTRAQRPIAVSLAALDSILIITTIFPWMKMWSKYDELYIAYSDFHLDQPSLARALLKEDSVDIPALSSGAESPLAN
ncbi:hypothetical protein BO83DRAFT_71680 [Aspergillus eucalypticola CBS 122712]|uniref:Uncharacterized protein n=1 Tax=Aspergillus eucalypticola (strain CBS 122712 / IBT 29274) TaxID=1448314 RepID=A0A317V8N7_ASPEC|nr:uncharacterized protein BO83DRAFT_71680 [Aspergillus eucalypticola CBS 122712]PWY69398.1 hypothetical protein BO83DRAFT_71680 [Aspergillus eucalypticola CBS 122712]